MKKLLLGLLSCFVSVALMAESSFPQNTVPAANNYSYSISLKDADIIEKAFDRYEHFWWKKYLVSTGVWFGFVILHHVLTHPAPAPAPK